MKGEGKGRETVERVRLLKEEDGSKYVEQVRGNDSMTPITH